MGEVLSVGYSTKVAVLESVQARKNEKNDIFYLEESQWNTSAVQQMFTALSKNKHFKRFVLIVVFFSVPSFHVLIVSWAFERHRIGDTLYH